MTMDGFAIELDELDAVVGDLESCERALESLTNDLEKQIRALQHIWEGLSAQAQAEAHEEWEQGMSAMRQALEGLRAAARQAHTNYTGSAQTNLRMWEQVR